MCFRSWLESFDTPTGQVVWSDAETDEALPGPVCGRHLRASFGHAGEQFWVTMDLVDDGVYDITFGTARRGVFLTGGGVPFSTMSRVMGVIRQQVDACRAKGFRYTPESQKRGRVFDKLFQRAFPDFPYDPHTGVYRKTR